MGVVEAFEWLAVLGDTGDSTGCRQGPQTDRQDIRGEPFARRKCHLTSVLIDGDDLVGDDVCSIHDFVKRDADCLGKLWKPKHSVQFVLDHVVAGVVDEADVHRTWQAPFQLANKPRARVPTTEDEHLHRFDLRAGPDNRTDGPGRAVNCLAGTSPCVSALLPSETRIGAVNLTVPNPDQVARFYRDTVGLTPVTDERPGHSLGTKDAELIHLREHDGDPGVPTRTAGLFHVAFRVPSRSALADALARIDRANALTGASDHGFSEAIYLRDPAGNGIEVYRDRPPSEWPWTQEGHLRAITRPLDLDAFRNVGSADDSVPRGTDIGHVHLAVADIDRSVEFYSDRLGFEITMRPTADAAFLAAGQYHHHIAVNTWEDRSHPCVPPGLEWFEIILPDETAKEEVIERLSSTDVTVEQTNGRTMIRDPDEIGVLLSVSG